MAQNGMGEIKAAEARLALAKKAEARSASTLKNAAAVFEIIAELGEALIRDQNVFEAARNALYSAHKRLEEAEKEANETRSDLKEAEDALKIVNDKWEIIEIDGDEMKEDDGGVNKRAVSPTDADEGGPNKKPRYAKNENEGQIELPDGIVRDRRYAQTFAKLIVKEHEVQNVRNVQSIEVEGCGTVAANGLYHRTNQIGHDGLPVFVHEYHEHISLQCDSAGSWGIFTLDQHNHFFQDAFTFTSQVEYQYSSLYCYNSDDHNSLAPINHEWDVSDEGAYPPPRLAVRSFL